MRARGLLGAVTVTATSIVAGCGGTAASHQVTTAKVGSQASNLIATDVAATYRVVVASATGVVPHSAHVEVRATGAPRRRFALRWETTCGWTQQGQAAVGGTGGHGGAILRSPAVTLIRLPRISSGVPSCYLAATASMAKFTRGLHLAIVAR